jgi:hypothetical protein
MIMNDGYYTLLALISAGAIFTRLLFYFFGNEDGDIEFEIKNPFAKTK